MEETSPASTEPTCQYRAHPAIGLELDGRRRATLFGEPRPPFSWMRLSPSQQEARALLFYRALLTAIATYPLLEARATFREEQDAREVAASAGLAAEGRTVTTFAPDPAALVRLADRPWRDLTINVASRPLLAASQGQAGVKLWLDQQQAAKVTKALAPTLVADQPASRRRTLAAALLMALDGILLTIVILVAVLVSRAADKSAPTAVALVIGVAIAVLIGWPLQAVGKALQRRYYDNAAS